MKLICPSCQQQVEVDANAGGMQLDCQACGKPFIVPTNPAALQKQSAPPNPAAHVRPMSGAPPKPKKKGCLIKALLVSGIVLVLLVVAGIVGWHKLVSWGEDFPERFPLHIAAAQGDLDSIRTLVAQGRDVNEGESFMHSTPLATAVSANQAEAARLLLQLGANPEKKDRKQWAPLHSGVTFKRASCDAMEVLLAAGADVDIRDKHLRTPLHRAAQFGKTNAVYLLLRYGADPLARDENGWTPIDRSIGQIVESARKPGIARILQDAAEQRNRSSARGGYRE